MSNNFEQQVKDLLDDVGIDPRQENWEKVRSQIAPVKRRRRYAAFWILPLLILMAGGVYIIYDNSKEQPAATASQKKLPSIENKLENSNIGLDDHQATERVVKEPLATLGSGESLPSGINKNDKVVQPFVKAVKAGNNKDQFIVEKDINGLEKLQPQVMEEAELAASNESFVRKENLVKEAEASKMPLLKNEAGDSLAEAITSASTSSAKDKRSWRTGIIAELGVAGRPLNWSKMHLESNTLYSPQLGSAVPTFTEDRFLKQGISAGFGAIAGKSLSKSFTFNTALFYLYQTYSAEITRYNVPATSTSSPPSVWYQATNRTQLHMLNLSTNIEYNILQKGKYKAGVGTGMDNMILIGVKESRDQTVNNGVTLNQTETSTSAAGFRRWQPSLTGYAFFELPVGKQALQFSPLIRYSLVGLEKQGNSKDHLGSYGVQVKYFFK